MIKQPTAYDWTQRILVRESDASTIIKQAAAEGYSVAKHRALVNPLNPERDTLFEVFFKLAPLNDPPTNKPKPSLLARIWQRLAW